MRSTWKRALATVLTIVMVAGLLVVPAAAATKNPETWNYTFPTEAGTHTESHNFNDGWTDDEGFFQFVVTDTTLGEEDADVTVGDLTLNKYANMQSSDDRIWFIAPADGTLTFVVKKVDSSKNPKLQNAGGWTIDPYTEGTYPAPNTSEKEKIEVELTKGAYCLKRGNATGLYYIAYTWEVKAQGSNPATSVTVAPETLELMVGGSAQPLTATVEPEDTDDTTEWTSSLTTVATVTDGSVTPVAIGKATITATAGNQSDACTVSVVGADQEGPVYTFNASNMGEGGLPNGTVKYDNYFSITANGSAVNGSSKEIAGENFANRLNIGSNGTITFTTNEGTTSTVAVWFAQNGERDFKLDDTTASSVLGTDMPTANNTAKVTFENVAAGAHTIAMVGGTEYIYQIVVTEESAPVVTKTDLADKTVSLNKTAPVVGDTLTATVSDSIPAADVDFVWTVGDTVATGKTPTYTVAAADMGKVIKVKAQAKTGSSTYENATPEVETSAVVGKTMTVSAANVTDTYDGTAKTITVTGAPTGATITYCATADGTYAATQPEMKNASATPYTVYYKVNAAGYQEATGSATVTINKAAAPDISFTVVNTNIPAEGRTVTFTVKGVPADSTVAPTAVCDQATEGSVISFTKQGDGSYKGTNNVTASDDGSARTHTVVMTWEDPNYATVTKTLTLKQAAQGAVVPAEAAGLAIGSGVDYAALGVDAVVSADDNEVTLNIDEAKILAAYAANPDTFKGTGMNHNGNAYMMVQFEAPASVDTTWTVKQVVNDGAEGAEWKLDGTGGDLDCWTADGKLMIGDWFGVLMGVEGATQSMPDQDTYEMLYNFYEGTECKAATMYTVVRNVIEAATVTLTANADLADVTVPAKVSPEEAFELTVAVKSGVDKVLPDTITVTKNGTAMAAANYTWDKTAGKLTIAADKINPADAIVVTIVPESQSVETVDKAALNAAITAAETAIDDIVVDTDAANVAEGTKWILAADKATYQAAIDAAKAVAAKADATQDEVDAAVTALATATTAFETAQKDGTKTEAPVVADKTALTAAIKAAQDKLTAAKTSEDGSDVLKTDTWLTAAAKTQLTADIKTAQDVADKKNATQDEVDAAVAALAAAVEAADIKAGTKAVTADDLKDAVDAANKAAEATTVAANASDVKKGDEFVTQATLDTYKAAIAEAQDVADNAEATADELEAALAALNEATAAFNAAKQEGTKSTGGGSRPSIGSGTKPNGETTKTETLGDGTTVTTTTDSKGVTTVVAKRPDGMETTTVTNEDGDVTITTVNADDVTLAEVKIPATIPANDQKFVDVPEGHWAEASINNMAALNMVKGVDDVNHVFDMNSDVTRGSVATILYRFASGKDGMSQNFSDVAEDQWYTDAVAWASNAGVVTGFEDGTFQPDGSITREQLAVMIFRYAKLIGLDVSGKGDLRIFTDGDKIQSWAVDGMSWCVKSGIINGRGDGTVDPTTAATRAEAAAMLDRFVTLLK